jgi:hypothetical protein
LRPLAVALIAIGAVTDGAGQHAGISGGCKCRMGQGGSLRVQGKQGLSHTIPPPRPPCSRQAYWTAASLVSRPLPGPTRPAPPLVAPIPAWLLTSRPHAYLGMPIYAHLAPLHRRPHPRLSSDPRPPFPPPLPCITNPTLHAHFLTSPPSHPALPHILSPHPSHSPHHDRTRIPHRTHSTAPAQTPGTPRIRRPRSRPRPPPPPAPPTEALDEERTRTDGEAAPIKAPIKSSPLISLMSMAPDGALALVVYYYTLDCAPSLPLHCALSQPTRPRSTAPR